APRRMFRMIGSHPKTEHGKTCETPPGVASRALNLIPIFSGSPIANAYLATVAVVLSSAKTVRRFTRLPRGRLQAAGDAPGGVPVPERGNRSAGPLARENRLEVLLHGFGPNQAIGAMRNRDRPLGVLA